MRFVKIDKSNAHGNPSLYIFHLGIEEMKLMLGLLRNYELHSPKGEDWLPDHRRAHNMIKAFKDHIKTK